MMRRNLFVMVFVFLAVFVFAWGSLRKEKSEVVGSSRYDDLVSLFKEWREFQKPRVIDGVPDYTAAAMKEQRRGLEKTQSRLAAIDCSSWPVSQQVDYHLVRAEMNGLEFDHRVMRPWSRDPCFYVVISKREPQRFQEGPEVYGLLHIPKFPLAEESIAEFRTKLRAIPKILDQAKENLTEEAKDLWFFGIRLKKKESGILYDLVKQLSQYHPTLVPDAERAKTGVDNFCRWLEKKQSQMTAPSGIGIENYNWYLKNVHLVPYTWQDMLVIAQRELDRALACLKLEENRNRRLPKLEPAVSVEEYQLRYDEAIKYFMDFLRKEEIFTVPDYMAPGPRLPFIALGGIRDFFVQIEYRDALPMRCHIHTFDDLIEKHDQRPRPIRGVPLLYSIWDTRAEGLATAFEEIMLHAGLFEKRRRTRELVYMLLANRAARAIGDLKMHSNEFTFEDAQKFAIGWTPYGWLPIDGKDIWYDNQLYLHQPGYGASYIVGKVQIDKLITDRSHQLGEKFSLKQFMDEFFAAGVIPIALSRWEMTGLDDEIKKLWQGGSLLYR